MEENNIIKKIDFAYFKDNKILMVRGNKDLDIFKFVGGKVEGNESDIECLIREVGEELDVNITENSLIFLNEFENIAYNKPNTKVHIYLYTGTIIGEPKPSSEIDEIKYCDTKTIIDPRKENPIAQDIFKWLKANKYIN